MMLSACGSKTGNVAETAETVDSLTTDSADVKTVANANIDSVKHTKDYINQRIDTIISIRTMGNIARRVTARSRLRLLN